MLKFSHNTAYGISVCERMPIRSQTLIYFRSTLGIRRVRSKYADIPWLTLCYTQRPKYVLDMFKIYQRMQAYRIYVIHTLTIRTAYAGYARRTLYTQKLRYSYVMKTLSIRRKRPVHSRETGLKVVRIRSFFSEICILFLKFAYAMHTL